MFKYVSPVHIHPLMNKTSYYLKTDGRSTNHVNIRPRAYPGQQPQEHLALRWNRLLSHKGLNCMPWNRNRIKSMGASTPHWNTCGTQVEFEVLVAQYLTIINKYTYRFHRFSPPQCKLPIYYRLSPWWSVYGDEYNNRMIMSDTGVHDLKGIT